jgi:CPA2 family monovalent cation:H+ antiporter-2
MEVPIIRDIVIIFALSIAVLLTCHRLKLPSVVGFLITGVLCGPHCLGLISKLDDVEKLATIGVVLLLFTIGMEFSVGNIIKYKAYFFGGGLIQVIGTIIATAFIADFGLGKPLGEAIFIGFLLALSSTAIVMRVLEEKGETESPHGRLTLGILIFQDIIAVPMMLLIPLLAGQGEEIAMGHVINFFKGIIVLFVMAIVAFRGVPKLLYYVARTKKHELFLVSLFTICFAVAWMTSSLGLSLSLGAFFAGLVISESEYSDEAVGNVLPFQEIFTSFFFVSMGMLLDLKFVMEQPFLILFLAFTVIAIKATVGAIAALTLGMSMRSAVMAAVAISQIGEFSFVLANSGMEHGLISDFNYQLFLSVSLVTMTIAPSLIDLSDKLAEVVKKVPLPKRLVARQDLMVKEVHQEHVIIVGFGLRGRHLARAAKEFKIPYQILEMNPEIVKLEQANGEPIHFGDPSHDAVLMHIGIKHAKTMAVVINDAVATKRIIRLARELNPTLYIITRTPAIADVAKMFQIGADDVVADEFGSSLEIFTRVLQKSEVPKEEIARQAEIVKREGYQILHWTSE